MATGKFLKGTDNLMRNLNREVRELKNRTHRGLIEAAIELQREAEPGTPIDLDNLRASWFIVSYKQGMKSEAPSFKGEDSGEMSSDHQGTVQRVTSMASAAGSDSEPVVIFGYSANYAVYVHENVGANFQRPGARARWLYAALQQAKTKMIRKIKKHAEF